MLQLTFFENLTEKRNFLSIFAYFSQFLIKFEEKIPFFYEKLFPLTFSIHLTDNFRIR